VTTKQFLRYASHAKQQGLSLSSLKGYRAAVNYLFKEAKVAEPEDYEGLRWPHFTLVSRATRRTLGRRAS
jgi:hypothetical protein